MAQSIMEMDIENLAEAQNRLRRTVEELQPQGAMGQAVQMSTLRLHRYMTTIVHRKKGRLVNSLFPEIRGGGLSARIFTNVLYAAIEEERGGTHAFMRRTVKEEGPATEKMALQYVERRARDAFG